MKRPAGTALSVRLKSMMSITLADMSSHFSNMVMAYLICFIIKQKMCVLYMYICLDLRK